MEQSPSWTGYSRSAIQEIPHFFCGTRMFITVFTTARQMHSVHAFSLSSLDAILILLSSLSFGLQESLPFLFSNQNFVCILHSFHACYMRNLSHPHWAHHPTNILWSVQVMKLLIMHYSPPLRPFLLLKSKYSPQHLVLNNPRSKFFHSLSDEVSNLYVFLKWRQEDKNFWTE